MSSETDSLFIPFIIGLTAAANSSEESQDQATPSASRDRIILISPSTQTMTVLETDNGSLGLESLLGDLFSRKSGQRPATKSSIDGLPRVEISKGENEDGRCVVCLEDWEVGEIAKEMPCKHRFHGGCIEQWLKISGCCPVCRYAMPVRDDDQGNKSQGENEGEIWLRFSFGMRNGENRESES